MKDVQQPGGGAVLVQLARRRLAAGIDRRFAAVEGNATCCFCNCTPWKSDFGRPRRSPTPMIDTRNKPLTKTADVLEVERELAFSELTVIRRSLNSLGSPASMTRFDARGANRTRLFGMP